MLTTLKPPLVGVIVALAITTAMDATGYSMFSALPLFPLFLLFWRFQRLPAGTVGLAFANWRHYLLAIFYPMAVIGSVSIIAWLVNAIDLGGINWQQAWSRCWRLSLATFFAALLTEEGFFRGWLWGSLVRAGQVPTRVLIFSSSAFALWHLSSILLDTGFNPPLAQCPVFLVNALLMGLVWGLQRHVSGSILVSSLSHGIWNGFAYVLFGFGKKVGALGVTNTALFGPEVGLLGLAVNTAFAFVFFRWWYRVRSSDAKSENIERPIPL